MAPVVLDSGSRCGDGKRRCPGLVVDVLAVSPVPSRGVYPDSFELWCSDLGGCEFRLLRNVFDRRYRELPEEGGAGAHGRVRVVGAAVSVVLHLPGFIPVVIDFAVQVNWIVGEIMMPLNSDVAHLVDSRTHDPIADVQWLLAGNHKDVITTLHNVHPSDIDFDVVAESP